MRRTGFLYDERFLLHQGGPEHPEAPERLLAILKGASENGLIGSLTRLEGVLPDFCWVEAVHSRHYITRFEEACLKGLGNLDHPDNEICEDSFLAAMLAAGGVIEASKKIMEGSMDNAFCAVRPPGHHATQDKAMGFCLLNNVAIAARYLQNAWGLERIGIVDFDVHHGNGTQHIFEEDDSVFFYSIHEHPSFAYPGTGREFEIGRGNGQGFTLNSPMLPGAGDEEYLDAIERLLVPAFDSFRPEFILVSAGFDGHKDDDMGDILLTTEGFASIMKKIMDICLRHSKGRILSVLEGGYCLERLPELARGHLEVLLDGKT
ncbi:MAG: histone deacetylase [Desulfobacteraceae bacterium]|nr:MAG: histone deacetylase [Desulfobacteraceae bacterium]